MSGSGGVPSAGKPGHCSAKQASNQWCNGPRPIFVQCWSSAMYSEAERILHGNPPQSAGDHRGRTARILDLPLEQRSPPAGFEVHMEELGLSHEQRFCLTGIIALSLPKEDQALGRFNRAFLQNVTAILELEGAVEQALRPLLYSEGNDPSGHGAQIQAFLRAFTPSDDALTSVAIRAENESYERLRYVALRNLLVLLASRCPYDARTRKVLRLAADAMSVPWVCLAKIECLVGAQLHGIWEATHAKDKVNKTWRYAKIGAAAVMGGGVMALTGGLAAPAIAVGLAAIGTTTAATVASLSTTAAVAALFGASGAGLVGYKMERRTAGVKQFNFRKHGGARGDEETEDDAKMTVCICISGWIKDDESEFDAPWGVEPSMSDVAGRLRLFYSVHNPSNVKHAHTLAERYRGRNPELEATCREKYGGASPFDPLCPPPSSPWTASPEEVVAEIQEVQRLILLHAPKSVKGKGQQGQLVHEGEEGGGRHGESPAASGESLAASELQEVKRIVALRAPNTSSSPRDPSTPEADEQTPSRHQDHAASSRDGSEVRGGSSDSQRSAEEPLSTDAPPKPLPPQRSSTNEDGIVADPSDEQHTEAEAAAQPLLASESAQQQQQQQVGTAPPPPEAMDDDVPPMPWWQSRMPFFDHYTLHWEGPLLRDLGQSVSELIASIGQQAALEALGYTAAATLVSALAWPITIIQAADMIDSTWNLACDRADRAGRILAQVLLKREHGVRPVILMGYSMGARVIMSCLQELGRVHENWVREQVTTESTKQEADNGSPASGLVHTAVLMGAPVPNSQSMWKTARSIVADRLVNCYSRKDYILGLMYRYQKLSLTCSGIGPVSVQGVEDCDVSHVIPGHQSYATRVRDILEIVRLDDSLSTYSFDSDSHPLSDPANNL